MLAIVDLQVPKYNMLSKYPIILASFLLLFSSCDKARIYEKNTDIIDYIWNKENKIIHNFSIEDTNAVYNILCNIRHTVHYPYQNIYIQYELKFPDGSVTSKLMSVQLADIVNERWVGDILGDIIDITSPVAEFQNYKFQLKGNYQITLEQDMRDDKLIGVMAVGVRVERKM